MLAVDSHDLKCHIWPHPPANDEDVLLVHIGSNVHLFGANNTVENLIAAAAGLDVQPVKREGL